MKTAVLNRLLSEVKDEEQKQKLCLIEDIMKAKKLLFGLDQKQHNEFLDIPAAGRLFDDLYDMGITQLTVIMKGYEREVGEIILTKMRESAK